MRGIVREGICHGQIITANEHSDCLTSQPNIMAGEEPECPSESCLQGRVMSSKRRLRMNDGVQCRRLKNDRQECGAHPSFLHRLLDSLCVVAHMDAAKGALIVLVWIPLKEKTLHRYHVLLQYSHSHQPASSHANMYYIPGLAQDMHWAAQHGCHTVHRSTAVATVFVSLNQSV